MINGKTSVRTQVGSSLDIGAIQSAFEFYEVCSVYLFSKCLRSISKLFTPTATATTEYSILSSETTHSDALKVVRK